MVFLQKTFRNTVLLLTSLFILAFAQNAEAQCAFNDLEWEVEDCVNGTFYLTFYLSNPMPSEDGFAIHKDFPSGYFVSLESYGESSYTVGPFAGDGSTFYQFTLYDYSTNNCEGTINVGVIDCPASDECALFASAQQSDCFDGGQFQWMFYINQINGGEDAGYTIYNAANEQVYFSDSYANNQNYALVEEQSNGVGETMTFNVVDNNNQDCQQTVQAVDLGCSLCEIDITSAVVTDCNDAGEYFIEFSISQMNSTTGQFMVGASYNGVQWGPFNYGEESYSIGPVISGGSENFIYVNDTEITQGSCYDSYTLGEIECPNACNLEISSVTPSECDNGQFFVTLDIISENGFSDAFNLVIGNDMFDGLPYGQGSYTVGPINQNNTGVYQAAIYDPLDDNCGGAFEFGPVDCTSNCELDISVLELSECNSNGQFFVDFEINYTDPAGTTFNAIAGSEEYGPFEYGQDFYTVGPFDGTGVTSYDLFIYDTEDAVCNSTSTFDSPECIPNMDCSLSLNSVEEECNLNGSFYITFNLESENSTEDEFIVSINETPNGIFFYGESPYTVGPIYGASDDENYNITIIDQSPDNCNLSEDFVSPDCPQCIASIVEINVSDCNSDNQYFVDFVVESSGPTSDVFTIFMDSGGDFGPFEYGQEIYTVGPIDVTGVSGNFILINDGVDGANGCLLNEVLFDEPECIEPDCVANIVEISVSDCNNDNQYFVDFVVESSGPTSDVFTIFMGSGEEFGPFEYGQETYTAGPIDIAGVSDNFILINDGTDNANSCLINEMLFDEPECNQPDCGFDDLTLDYQGCNEENGTMFLVNFNAVGTGDEGFDVTVNGEFLSFHLYDDMPVIIGIPAQSGNFAVLNFCDNDNPDCCTEAFADVVNCDETGECGLWMNGAQFTDCVDGSFNIFVPTINTDGVLSETFNAYINDVFVGNYSYDQEDWLFGPVTLDGETSLVLSILDSENETCPASLNFGTVNPCDSPPECAIGISVYELQECNDEGQFYLDFEVTGLEVGDQFSAFGNGAEYGVFTFGESFYTVGPFNGNENGTSYELIISSQSQDDCVFAIDFMGQECETNECQINIPFVEVGECNADGQFFIDFEMLPIDGDGTVQITGNGQNYGIYDYNLPLYTVGPFDGTETATYELIVTDTANPDCVQILTFASANCTAEECNMSLTFDEYAQCFGDNQYYVIVSVTNGNVDEGSFTFTGNGQVYGTEEYGAGSYAVGPFNSDGGIDYELIATDNQDETCSVELTFDGQECEIEPVCNFEITFVENHECDEGAQFLVDFGIEGVASGDQFSVFGNGANYGTFSFGQDVYTVGPFNGDGADYDLIISVVGLEECVVDGFVQGQNCLDNFPCGFNDISTEYNGCSDDGVYFYTLDFIPINTTNEFFDLTINGQTDFYAYSALPIDIQIFPNDENIGALTICDNDNPNCCHELFIELPECETGMCNINVIEYELTECDEIGNFYVDFSIGIANPMNDVFFASHNGITYGPFEFGQSTYQIGPLDGLETAVFEIDIFVEGIEECSTQIVFDSANCEPNEDCDLSIPEFDLIDCDPDNQFYVQFAVDANSPDAATFVATGNGENYGTFNYEDGFYIVGPFDGNLDPVWELIITDSENENCSTSTSFVSPDCNNENCSLDITAFELGACNEEGQFYVDFGLVNENSSGSFVVVGNGQNYGVFDYGQTSYTVGPFSGDGNSSYEIIVADVENDGCSAAIEFGALDCGITPPCSLSGLEYDLDCVDNEFYIILSFNHSGETAETFNVFGNATSYGEFEYAEDEMTQFTLGPLAANETEYEFIIYDGGDDACTTGYLELGQVNTVDCTAGNGDVCNLEVADYFSTDCNNEGEFFVQISLTETSFGSTFEIFSDNDVFGPFEYGEEIYTVGPFPSWDGSFSLEINDTGFDQCFDNIFIEEVECPISDCFIENLEVATGECNDENTYSVIIDFFYNDIGGEFFNLIYAEEVIGTYETANLPITIEDFAGNAEVETLTVCMTDFEDCCMSIDFLSPQCEGLITWPGDGNFDGITNNVDILNMGVAYGFEGPERATDNIGWDAQSAFAWQNNFASGANYVHADADGNGVVNMLDSDVVSTNYDLTHDEVTPYVELEPNDSSPELFVDMPDPFELQQGMQFNAPIIFGLENLPVDNVYGLAFTLRYDPEIIDPGSILLEYPVSWLGFPQTNLMTFDYHDIDLGEIDVAITKIDQNNVSGWGEILSFIGIIDNIAGKAEVFIEIDNVTAILSNEERFPVNTPTEITTITSTEDINELQGFELFPNPTNNIVRIKNETGLTLQSIQISDLNGKVLRNVNGDDSFSLSELPSGVYMAKVVFEGKTIFRKIVKL